MESNSDAPDKEPAAPAGKTIENQEGGAGLGSGAPAVDLSKYKEQLKKAGLLIAQGELSEVFSSTPRSLFSTPRGGR